MKQLRNKKTGEIGDLLGTERAAGLIIIDVAFDDGKPIAFEYTSLDQVNEEWEDYDPVGPLIEDEKSRKVFREWAGFFGAERFRVNHLFDSRRNTTSIGSTDLTIEPSIDLPGHIGEDSEIYTITELIGKEAE